MFLIRSPINECSWKRRTFYSAGSRLTGDVLYAFGLKKWSGSGGTADITGSRETCRCERFGSEGVHLEKVVTGGLEAEKQQCAVCEINGS